MDCPVCREPMVVLELQEVEIDYCFCCKGIWLDGGELELLLEDAAEKDKLLASFEPDKHTREKRRKCPICLKKMEKVLGGTDRKIRIDKCRNNDGLWFDEGELADLLTLGNLGGNNKVADLLSDMFDGNVKSPKRP